MDEIRIEDIEIFAHHGVFDSEKRDGQRFYVTIAMYVDALAGDDDLAHTVDYGAVTMAVKKYVENNVFDLIETVARGVAREILLGYPLVKSVTVTIKKPDAPIPTTFGNVMVTAHMCWHTAYLALGSNIGDKKGYLDMATRALAREDTRVIKVSSYIETPPYGVTDQPDFLNGALKVETLLEPHELLALCQHIESDAGRVRVRRWGERTLDVDILLYDDDIIHDESLIVPHLEMHMRDFVLRPLVEIDAGVVHPVLHKTAYMLLKELEI